MSGLFTPERRQTVFDNLLELFKNDDRITGIISTGSGDRAFADDNDSIDLLIIIEKPSIIEIVFTLWIKRLEDFFKSESIFDFIINKNINYLSILLNDFLQINIQIRALNRFYLVGTDWHIVFDRNENMKTYLDKRTKTREQHVRSLYEKHVHTIWKPVVSCVRELRRQNLWKALAELEILRKHLVEISGLRHLEFTQDYLNLELLPEMFLVQLRHTLPTNISDTAIRRSLKTTLGMLFTETTVLDEKFKTTYTQQLQSRLSSFVELYS